MATTAPTEPKPAAPAESGAPKGPHLDSILQIPVAVQVFLGSASMPIADLMKLGRGAIVALDHAISDPVDVVVNGRIIARGELVAMDDDPSRIGVKLTEIIGRPDAA
ncbi:Flagellar motor switch protein FliN [Beijerinckiaceae bacterium RH AL1]|nr:flagellar motor switch protein FliN [Beijerinckiaceae bacterium]VVB49026.1 Flagellar motor switch protein FliN [Beijerinckiaceae bacterium RH CH11]VVB49105.1 Flagellar motor switch protein FliN [Beijerinckiaceae bacterium RH AL8]VVC56690.1 Flagellar motor switch protein FliN [Beijerinckiaceae bacterium RH AL1]